MSDAQTTYFDEAFASQRIMAILRGYSPEETVRRVDQAWDLGIEVVEVPVESPKAMPSLLAALDLARARGRTIGAGTICTIEQLETVAEAGVAFTVAPGLDLDVTERSKQLGLPHLPGVSSASEIQRAQAHGHRWIKAFPASVLGVDWFKAMRGPFPELRIVATGGMAVENASEFLDAGADVVALGSSLSQAGQLGRIGALLNGERS
jgi:2-dehydro-3-deoxyphosphogluconate aldolase/(4S)-4-hydroxy-2-oxoglutarate aldolase